MESEQKLCPNCKGVVHPEAKKCPHCRSKLVKKQYGWKHVFIILGVIATLGVLGSLGDKEPPQNTNQVDSTCTNFNQTQVKTINFPELDKNPDSFKGTFTTFTGQVVQIQESNNKGFLRLSVTKEDYGWSLNDIIYVEYTGHTDAVEDDVITVSGQLTGSETYKSQANFEITIPSMTACVIEKGTSTKATQAQSTIRPTSQKTTETSQTQTQPIPVSATSNGTVSQQNAVRAAKEYLNYTAFSHDGLVAQLEYDQFSHMDAVYGADNSGANWDQEAAADAKAYMEYSAFSRDGLIKQLEYDKFTQAQAEYGANSVGL